MTIVRKIKVTEDQASWLDREIALGNIANENEFISDLIEEAKLRATQTTTEITRIQEMLVEAEIGGISSRDPDEIWNELLEIK